MRVVTFNLHAGVDGWGRPTAVLDTVATLGVDILVAQEVWRSDTGADAFVELQDRCGLHGVFAPLARAERVLVDDGGPLWQPLSAHLTGEHGLYFREHRDLKGAQRRRRERVARLEHGTWGLALLTRLAIEELRVESLDRLPREKVDRAVIFARLHDGARSFWVVGVHGAHISHGSRRQYRRISQLIDGLGDELPVLIAGDFNCWRPLLRLYLPGWRTLVRRRTWPARLPHSQIDHILGRGPWRVSGGFTRQGGSDHRALGVDVTLAPRI